MMGLLKNIVRGILSINLFPPPRPPYKAPEIKSDEEAIRENWEIVGKDLQRAMDKIDKIERE